MISAAACLAIGATFLAHRVRLALGAFDHVDLGHYDDSIFDRRR